MEGYSPARDALLAVYALLPKPMNPPQLERLAGLLSGDARFEAHAIAAEDLPFPARGHAVVDLREGRVLAAAVPEEVRRRLEEHRARRPVILLGGPYDLDAAIPLDELLELRDELRRLGLGFEARLLGYEAAASQGALRWVWRSPLGFAVELRAPRPLPAEERARVRRLLLQRFASPAPLPRGEEEALERAGLLALAETVPGAYWKAEGGQGLESFEGGAVREEEVRLLLRALPSDLSRQTPLRGFAAKGARGEAYCTREGVYAAARSVDDRFLELAEKAKGAADRLAERYIDWLHLLHALERAESRFAPFLSTRVPIAGGADPHEGEPRAKVWEEGGKVKVWLSPELKEELERSPRPANRAPPPPEGGLRGYLRRLSGELGREVELVGEEPPFRFSPEVDEAAEELKRALRELAGEPTAAGLGAAL